MAPHSSILAWKIPWMEEPGGLQSTGSLRVRHDWATSLSLFTLMHWRRKWQLAPVFLAWRIPGLEEPGGLPSMGSHRVRHDWSDLAAAAAMYLWIFHIFSWLEAHLFQLKKSFHCIFPGAQLLHCMVRVYLVCKKQLNSLLKGLYYFAFPTAVGKNYRCSPLLLTFGGVNVLDYSHSNRCIVISLLCFNF